MEIKAIIVDDEFLARQRLMKLLEVHPEVHIVAEARNGDVALEEIEKRSPDLVFLDIQMPGKSGFDVLKSLPKDTMPIVVFTTAFDQYALRAFEVNALDYLLKPFDQERFDVALSKAKERLKNQQQKVFSKHVEDMLISYDQGKNESLTSIRVKEKGREQVVRLDDVEFIESAGNYMILHTTEGQVIYRSTMNGMYEQLNKSEFFRIHRSFILNRRFVKNYKYLSGNEYEFMMKGGKNVKSSKGFKSSIDEYLSLYFG